MNDKTEFIENFSQDLKKSADLVYNFSLQNCNGSFVDAINCKWYHSAWQFLRLCDKVSSPFWHYDFYIESLKVLLSNDSKILISGTADYSLLAIIIYLSKQIGLNPKITVLDICKTPLYSCEWYANKEDYPIKTIHQNLFSWPTENEYDIIITDAFLTRFDISDKELVLKRWYELLKFGGSLITTVRLSDENEKTKVLATLNQIEEYVEEVANIHKQKFGDENISMVRSLARDYINQMTSFPFNNDSQIIQILKRSSFTVSYIQTSELKGEAKPTNYCRLIATK